jgi:hypothetical protein
VNAKVASCRQGETSKKVNDYWDPHPRGHPAPKRFALLVRGNKEARLGAGLLPRGRWQSSAVRLHELRRPAFVPFQMPCPLLSEPSAVGDHVRQIGNTDPRRFARRWVFLSAQPRNSHLPTLPCRAQTNSKNFRWGTSERFLNLSSVMPVTDPPSFVSYFKDGHGNG